MKLKSSITIISICAIGVAVIIILFAMAEKPFPYRQHFSRVHSASILKLQSTLPVKLGTYIAGATAEQFYLGSENHPLTLIITDKLLNSLDTLYLHLRNINSDSLASALVEVQFPYVYVKAGQVPGIFRFNLNDPVSYTLIRTPYFQQATVISPTSFVVQTEGYVKGSEVKRKLLCLTSNEATYKKALELSQDVNSYFTAQGILRYSHELSRLLYIHYYHNTVMVLDTVLSIVYKANTIDTISQAKVKPKQVGKDLFSLASIPAVVNLNEQVAGRQMYVHSNLMATNNDRKAFDHSSAIDVYDIETIKYQYSFYLPDYNGEKLKTFRVYAGCVVAVYPNFLCVYKLETQ